MDGTTKNPFDYDRSDSTDEPRDLTASEIIKRREWVPPDIFKREWAEVETHGEIIQDIKRLQEAYRFGKTPVPKDIVLPVKELPEAHDAPRMFFRGVGVPHNMRDPMEFFEELERERKRFKHQQKLQKRIAREQAIIKKHIHKHLKFNKLMAYEKIRVQRMIEEMRYREIKEGHAPVAKNKTSMLQRLKRKVWK